MRSRTIWWNQSTTHTKFENDFAIIIVRLRCRSRQTSDMMTISFVGLSPLSKKTEEAEKSKSRHFCRVRFRWRRLVMRETRTTAHTLSALFCWGGETRCASSFFFRAKIEITKFFANESLYISASDDEAKKLDDELWSCVRARLWKDILWNLTCYLLFNCCRKSPWSASTFFTVPAVSHLSKFNRVENFVI